jgi:hypothetical protein
MSETFPRISEALRQRLLEELSKEAEWDGMDRPVNEAAALYDHIAGKNAEN